MNHAHTVCGIERKAYLLHDCHGLFGRKLLAPMNQRAQVMALDVFHGDELHAITFAEVVDADNVSMRNALREPQFLLEALDDGPMPGEVRANYFESDEAIEFQIASLVDGPHAALPERLQNLVASRQNRSGLKLGVRRASCAGRCTGAWTGRGSIRQSRGVGRGYAGEM